MAEDIPATAALFVTGIVLTDMLDAQKIGRRQAHFPPRRRASGTKAQ